MDRAMSNTLFMQVQHWTRDMEKQLGARVQIVLGNPMLLSVFERFGAETFRRSSVFHGLEKILADNAVRGKTCFEIGTWNGLTAVVLSQFFERVITVDIVSNPLKHMIIAHLGIKNIECIDMESNADKSRVLRGLAFDFAYLDGNHAEDTESDWDATKRCGRVLFHEVWPFQSPVWSLVHALPSYQIVHNGAGLALWDKSRPRLVDPENG
jgi:hypothetical protein